MQNIGFWWSLQPKRTFLGCWRTVGWFETVSVATWRDGGADVGVGYLGGSCEVYVWLFMSLFYIKFTICTFTFSALNSTLIINIDVFDKCSLALWLSLLYCTSYTNKQIKKSKANRGSLFMASVCWSGCYKINCSWGNKCCVDFFSPSKYIKTFFKSLVFFELGHCFLCFRLHASNMVAVNSLWLYKYCINHTHTLTHTKIDVVALISWMFLCQGGHYSPVSRLYYNAIRSLLVR